MNILITGSTGTIGKAFVDFLISEGHSVCGIDHNEERVATAYIPTQLGEFDDADLSYVDLVIHMAAFKHIDLCETNTNACVVNNVIRTHRLFQRAHEAGVKILFMSTDKAVEPTSMYGFSKALGEGMAKEYGGAYARSGNVLLSTGSVLNIWEEAIKNNLPIKVTHPDMKRYFISPENLVKRIWRQYEAGITEIIPEMDSHMKLVDMAEDLLKKHGYTKETYKPGIEFIGLRPGEKLEEKLQWQK